MTTPEPAVPALMQAVEIARPGPPEVLRLTERPVPALAPGEVLIRVAAAGVNRPDLLQRTGNYPPPPGITDIPGLEVAGEVVRVAPGVDTLRVGDRVCALVAGGGYAQFVAVPAVQCLPVPANASIEEAAALPETFFTVYLNVFERAELGHGETLLVHGGSSGIGTTAILMARAMGARVFVTAGTQRKCDACRALGAELAINYREQDFVPAVLAATEGRGVDVILDMVGGAYLPRNIAAAATDGRIALIATQGGTRGGGSARRAREAAQDHGRHAQAPNRGAQGPAGGRAAHAHLAAVRARRAAPATDPCALSAGAGRAGARGHGIRGARGQAGAQRVKKRTPAVRTCRNPARESHKGSGFGLKSGPLRWPEHFAETD